MSNTTECYLPGLEPLMAERIDAEDFKDRRNGRVIEAWKVSAVCEAEIEIEARTIEHPSQVLSFWSQYVVRHPAFSAEQEAFVVFCLNRRNRLRGWQLVGLGTASSCLVHPREVFRIACIAGACAIVVAHNHPSGDPEPSSADLQITRQLASAARAVEIGLIDHVVIGMPARDPAGRGYYSFREAGLV